MMYCFLKIQCCSYNHRWARSVSATMSVSRSFEVRRHVSQISWVLHTMTKRRKSSVLMIHVKLWGWIAFLGEFGSYYRSKRFDVPSCRPNVHFEWFTHMCMVLILIMLPNVYTTKEIRHGAVCLLVSLPPVVVYHTSVAGLFRDAVHVHCTL
jgi:hypothetical protein